MLTQIKSELSRLLIYFFSRDAMIIGVCESGSSDFCFGLGVPCSH